MTCPSVLTPRPAPQVDVLRDMGHRASQAETTIESYKKKLEELSDLRRQHRILEEKNADYMQHIIELEEVGGGGGYTGRSRILLSVTRCLGRHEDAHKCKQLMYPSTMIPAGVVASCSYSSFNIVVASYPSCPRARDILCGISSPCCSPYQISPFFPPR